MNKIPCKKCPECNIFNDFTIKACECGKDLSFIGAQFIDTDELSPEVYGEINTSIKIYVQKCSNCGAISYTADPENRVKQCYNCHKTRIASVEPVEYSEEKSNEAPQDTEESKADDSKVVGSTTSKPISSQVAQGKQSDADDNVDASAPWKSILGNIQKTVGNASEDSNDEAINNAPQTAGQSVAAASVDFDDDDDDDDVDVGDWSGILGITPKQKSAPTPTKPTGTPATKKDITLTAIRYGRCSFTVQAGQGEYLLGRSAEQAEFLLQDGRVGNRHCYLFYRNGAWFVRDNNSSNGTAVNSRDIGLNGECMLSDGDELKLGHHPDSMAFRITIN